MLKDSETLDMEAVYTVIDFYKKAILLTKEVEVHKFLFRLDYINLGFAKVFESMRQRAHDTPMCPKSSLGTPCDVVMFVHCFVFQIKWV